MRIHARHGFLPRLPHLPRTVRPVQLLPFMTNEQKYIYI